MADVAQQELKMAQHKEWAEKGYTQEEILMLEEGRERYRREIAAIRYTGQEEGFEKGVEKGIELGVERGVEKGIKKGVGLGIKQERELWRQDLSHSVFKLMKLRFGEEIPQSVENKIKKIDAIEKCTELFQAIMEVKDYEEFERKLDSLIEK